MAETTPEERAVYISHFVEAKNSKDVPAKEAVKQQSIAQIRAAVAAEHARTKEAMARAHDEAAAHVEFVDEIMSKGKPVAYSPEANWHRQQAAAIRAMPEQGAERGKTLRQLDAETRAADKDPA